MALIRIETNVAVPEDKSKKMTSKLIAAAAVLFAEPENAIRVQVTGNRKMRMAGDDEEPVVHVELRDVDFPKDRAKELTDAITPILRDWLGAQENNVYIAVVTKRTSMWRVNGDLSKKEE